MDYELLRKITTAIQRSTENLHDATQQETVSKAAGWILDSYETLGRIQQTSHDRLGVDVSDRIERSVKIFLDQAELILAEMVMQKSTTYRRVLTLIREAVRETLSVVSEIAGKFEKAESSRLILDSVSAEGFRYLSQIEMQESSIAIEVQASEVLQNAKDLAAEIGSYKSVAESAALKSQEAAGLSGVASFSRHFQDLAQRHLKLANNFRGWTFALTVLVVCAALASVVLILIWPETFPDWQALAAKGSLILAISALATYTSRQAGHHRRMADWAESVETQIKSTQGILDAMQDDQDKSHAYKLFVSRVLAPPPDKNSQQVDLVSTAQIMEALSSIMKKSA